MNEPWIKSIFLGLYEAAKVILGLLFHPSISEIVINLKHYKQKINKD